MKLDKAKYDTSSYQLFFVKYNFFPSVKKSLFTSIMSGIKKPLCNNPKLKKGLRFQIFGVDIAPDNMLNIKLIEINKCPDLCAKGTKDNLVKKAVVEDIFDIVGLVKKKTGHNFIKVM